MSNLGWNVVITFAFIGAAFAASDDASAKADVLCEVRSEGHIAKYGGLAKDSAEHVARGELPTCDPNDKGSSQEVSSRDSYEHDQAGDKSRYCKKRWFC
jgi:hypothetical protein